MFGQSHDASPKPSRASCSHEDDPHPFSNVAGKDCYQYGGNAPPKFTLNSSYLEILISLSFVWTNFNVIKMHVVADKRQYFFNITIENMYRVGSRKSLLVSTAQSFLVPVSYGLMTIVFCFRTLLSRTAIQKMCVAEHLNTETKRDMKMLYPEGCGSYTCDLLTID
jgi:hypothetical protein